MFKGISYITIFTVNFCSILQKQLCNRKTTIFTSNMKGSSAFWWRDIRTTNTFKITTLLGHNFTNNLFSSVANSSTKLQHCFFINLALKTVQIEYLKSFKGCLHLNCWLGTGWEVGCRKFVFQAPEWSWKRQKTLQLACSQGLKDKSTLNSTLGPEKRQLF